jgi:hypothetical protein
MRVGRAVLVSVSALGFALRLYAAHKVGFGDSEALYASYALHPQPAYLDHPGLVGVLARALGQGGPPSPRSAHAATAVLASLAPWITVLAARAARANWGAALMLGLAVAAVPEVAVGLFAMTPDLLLFPAWTASLGLACVGLLAPASSVRAAVCLVLAGLAAGIGLAAKVSAGALILALAVTYASRAARPHACTLWPWAGLALGAIVVFPVGVYEAKMGWPMLQHRLVATQNAAGVSFRNLGALVGGQLVYLSPPLAVMAALVGWDLWRSRKLDIVASLLSNALVVPLAALVPLCLWSRVAEPHWIAPALLALPIHYARPSSFGLAGKWRRLGALSVAIAGLLSLATYAWVLAPCLVALVPASMYDGRIDLANELYGWASAVDAIRDMANAHRREASGPLDIVVVGPHWVICAQMEARLRGELPVGCAGAESADFAYWNPRARWEHAALLIYVRDARFPIDGEFVFPDRVRIDGRRLDQTRGGRLARSFTIEVWSTRGGA